MWEANASKSVYMELEPLGGASGVCRCTFSRFVLNKQQVYIHLAMNSSTHIHVLRLCTHKKCFIMVRTATRKGDIGLTRLQEIVLMHHGNIIAWYPSITQVFFVIHVTDIVRGSMRGAYSHPANSLASLRVFIWAKTPEPPVR